MYKLFFLFIGMIVVFNLYLLLVPDGKYEKYINFVTGLVVMFAIAQSFSKAEIDTSFLTFDFGSEYVYENNEVSAVALEQWIEGVATGYLDGDVEIKVHKQGSEIQTVEIYTDSHVSEEEIVWLSEQCDINRNKFLIK